MDRGGNSDDVPVRSLGPDHSGVATIEMSGRPVTRLSVRLVRGVADAIDQLGGDQACRVIVLHSTTDHFCGGWDHAAAATPGEDAPNLYEQAARIIASPVPLVAAIDGPCAGGGVGLALMADFRVMGPNGTIDLYFALQGRFPGMGISLLLPWLVGPHRATEILSRGRTVGGAEAERIGLCDVHVDDRGAFAAAVDDVVTSVAAAHPSSIREIRRALRGELVEGFAAATGRELAVQRRMRAAGDHD